MAGESHEDRWRIRHRRRPLADLYGDEPEKEGEVVPPGYHSDAETEEYYNTNRGCSSDDSDETISDSLVPADDYRGAASTSSPAAASNNGVSGGASTAAAANNNGRTGGASSATAALACPFCGKEFRNHKAVCGHIKVHREQGIGKANKKGTKRKAPAVGVAGKRGCSGSRGSAAPPIDEPDQSMTVVVAEAKIVFNPMPLAFAAPNPPPAPTATGTPDQSTPMASPSSKVSSSSVPVASVMTNDSVESSSAQPTRDDDAMETVAAAAANPPTEAVVHPHAAPPPPPPAAGEQAPPVHEQPVAPPPGGRQDPRGYTCKMCGMWFRTHQGLGGHVVGHKNREIAGAFHGGAVRNGRDDAKPGKPHVCKVCGREFPGGLQLGGHMRKHWTGAPLNKTKPRLRLALSIKADEASPAPMPGRVLLFGIDIGAGVKTPAAQECSPEPEASASTGGEQ